MYKLVGFYQQNNTFVHQALEKANRFRTFQLCYLKEGVETMRKSAFAVESVMFRATAVACD